MFKSLDIRYDVNSLDLCSVESVIFPIYITVNQTSAVNALAEARKKTEEFCQFFKSVATNLGRSDQCDFKSNDGAWKGKFVIQQVNKSEVKLTLEYCGILTFEEATQFWDRASSVAICVDAIQEFCIRNHGKHIEVLADIPKPQILKVRGG